MKPLDTNRPRMNILNKGYRVKKTISHDASSLQDDTERKLYIFRAQARTRERSNRKSNPHHYLPSTSRNTESSRSPSDARPESEISPPQSTRKDDKKSESETDNDIFIDRVKAAMEQESLAVAARAKKCQTEKGMNDSAGEADGNEEIEEEKIKSPPPEKEKPIKFLDSLGRRFTFPFETCASWQVRFESCPFRSIEFQLSMNIEANFHST